MFPAAGADAGGSASTGSLRGPRQGLPVAPGHPLRRRIPDPSGVPLELGEVLEGVLSGELRGVDQAHEDVSHPRAVLGEIEEGVLPVDDRLLQGPFDELLSRGALGTRRKRVSLSQRRSMYSMASPRPELGSTSRSLSLKSIQARRTSIRGPLSSWWRLSLSSGERPSSFARASIS